MTTSSPSSPRSSPRKRGAPVGNKNASGHGGTRGNKNAAKHGFYSHWFTPEENKRLDRDRLGELDDEEFILNTMLDRILASTVKENMTHDQYVVDGRAVALIVGRIESIHRSRKAIYDNQTTLDKALEDLKYIPLEQD